jgi:hypothetical protein
MESAVKRAKDLVKHGLVKEISPTMFEVEDQTINITKKSGARLITCSCCNHSRNCNSPAFCYHKISVIIYLANKDFLQRIKNLIEQYEGYKEHKLNPSVDCFIDDLNSIKEKW